MKFTLGPDLCCASLSPIEMTGMSPRIMASNEQQVNSKEKRSQATFCSQLHSIDVNGVAWGELRAEFNFSFLICIAKAPQNVFQHIAQGLKTPQLHMLLSCCSYQRNRKKAILSGGWSCFTCCCTLPTFSERKGDRMPLGPVCCTPPAATHGNLPSAGRMQQLHFKCPVPLADKLLHGCRCF